MRRGLTLGLLAFLVFWSSRRPRRPSARRGSCSTRRPARNAPCRSRTASRRQRAGRRDRHAATLIDARPKRFLRVKAAGSAHLPPAARRHRARRSPLPGDCESGIAIYRLGSRGRKHYVRSIDLPASPSQFLRPATPRSLRARGRTSGSSRSTTGAQGARAAASASASPRARAAGTACGRAREAPAR